MRKIAMSSLAVASVLALAACGSEPAADDGAGVEAAEPVAPEPVVEVAFADLTGDATAGESVYGQCRACHMLEEGRNGVGPSLHGIIGRTAGTVEGFRYSDANASSGVTWTPETMFEYLESPREFMPGNRMAFAGVRDAQDRADLIAYLEAASAD